jgi:ABC-type lipoprotein release transport system permease subunit
LALALSRSLDSWLFGVNAFDWLSYAAVTALVLAASAVASVVPAHRAVRIDPMVAIRND